MSNIWSNVGGGLTPQGDNWLYQKEGQVHGPVPKESIENKILAGEITPSTHVAREGGDFHPISQVAAFSDAIETFNARVAAAARKKRRNVVIMAMVVVAGLVGGGGYFFKLEADKAATAEAKKVANLEAERAKQRKANEKLLNEKVELVALVSLGDIKDMQVGSSPSKPTRNSRRPKAKTPAGSKEPAQMVSQCQRSQGDIFGVLRKNLAKINICVEDEKKRDAQGLLPKTLVLRFVARTDGKVVEFAVGSRHYRTGPMRNCMLKAFNTIRFPAVSGSNCPVSIPIKIGG